MTQRRRTLTSKRPRFGIAALAAGTLALGAVISGVGIAPALAVPGAGAAPEAPATAGPHAASAAGDSAQVRVGIPADTRASAGEAVSGKAAIPSGTAVRAGKAAIPSEFIDVQPSDDFFSAIDWMRTEGLSTGVRTARGQAYFPKRGLSREAMAAFMYRQADPKGYTPPATSPFVDVPTTHQFYRQIAWMRETGLSTGTRTAEGREYRPKDRISREAMAAFIYRSEASKGYAPPAKSPFVGLPTTHKFYREIAWMASAGLTSGNCTPRGNEYLPSSRLSREAMAAFMYRQAQGTTVSLTECAKPNLTDPSSITVVVNKQRPLAPIDWAPGDLVMPAGMTNSNGQPVRATAARALEKMAAAMRAETGRQLIISSGFRSYQLQTSLFNSYTARDGLAAAETYSARPGHSEHQLGLAVDLDDGSGCNLNECFGGTAAGQWLRANAYRFGFILRYDAGTQPVVGYVYEPWHFRYIGTAVARDMHDRGFRTLEQYFGLPAAPTY